MMTRQQSAKVLIDDTPYTPEDNGGEEYSRSITALSGEESYDQLSIEGDNTYMNHMDPMLYIYSIYTLYTLPYTLPYILSIYSMQSSSRLFLVGES